MFKLICAVVGFLIWDFWGAVLGFVVGIFIDRARNFGTKAMNPLSSAMRQFVFIETLFTLMGRIAKVDGHISQQEISYAEQFMFRLGMSETSRKQAIALFKRGADPTFDIKPTCQRFMQTCGKSESLPQMLLIYLIVMAHTDGVLHPTEKTLLLEIAAHLNYTEESFNLLLSMVENQGHFAHAPKDTRAALEDAYKALGLNKDCSDTELKRAYRKLISQYHPDKLIGQGMPADMVAMATEQSKEIQLAYDLIKESRGLA